MSETVTEEKPKLELVQNAMYRHIVHWHEHWKRSLVFSETGLLRMASIAGYIQGLVHAGQEEFAKQLVEDLCHQLEWLGHESQEMELEFTCSDGTKEKVKVPPRKVVLSDDGTLHSFSFAVYSPVNLDVYEARLEFHRQCLAQSKETPQFDTPHACVAREFKIMDRINHRDPYSTALTEQRYTGTQFRKVYYAYTYNGGLIYHGPGAGETFSVLISDKPTLWSIHT